MDEQPLPRLKWNDWIRRNSRLSISIIVGVVVLVGTVVGGYFLAAKPVTLQVDGQELIFKTKSATVTRVLEEQQIQLQEGDQVVPGLEDPVGRNMTITVYRAKPVKLSADGKEQDLKTIQATVGEFLQEAGVVLGQLDRVEPELDSQIEPGLTVKVSRVEKKLEEKEVVIPYTSEKKEDKTIVLGQTKTLQQGKDGKKLQKLEITYVDGKPEETTVLSEQVIAQPVTKVVAYGTKRTVATVSTSRGDLSYSRKLTMTATAYSPQEPGLSNRTYTGAKATKGVVAVDPKVIPLGTKLYIDGYGYAVAADIGGAIKGNKIDLCYDTLAEVKRFGRRSVTVYVLDR
jgi:uncharacterized protein YabE (DUF348 family)